MVQIDKTRTDKVFSIQGVST